MLLLPATTVFQGILLPGNGSAVLHVEQSDNTQPKVI